MFYVCSWFSLQTSPDHYCHRISAIEYCLRRVSKNWVRQKASSDWKFWWIEVIARASAPIQSNTFALPRRHTKPSEGNKNRKTTKKKTISSARCSRLSVNVISIQFHWDCICCAAPWSVCHSVVLALLAVCAASICARDDPMKQNQF